ncbi:MAG: hypothetical protein ABEJ70_08260 [Halobacteriaceae archaeon]
MRPLAPAVLLALALTAGCLGGAGAGTPAATTGAPTTSTTTTDGTVAVTTDAPLAVEALAFDHADTGSTAIEGGVRYDPGSRARRYYATLLTARAETDRLDAGVLPADAAAFVNATDFDESVLGVVQFFPASSAPDYRVVAATRAGDAVRLSVDDAAPGRTADVTVETLLVRLPRGETAPDRLVVTTGDGVRFDSDAGVVVREDERPTSTTSTLPYRGGPGENVDDPRDVHVRNVGPSYDGYRVRVTYLDRPACRDASPPCARPTREVPVLDRLGKLHANESRTVADVAARRGTYVVHATAMVPAGDGGRRELTAEATWRVNDTASDLRVVVADDGVGILTGE